MKRSPLRRKTPLTSNSQLERRTPIRRVSQKRARLNRERAKFVADYLSEHPRCEARERIARVDARHRCDVQAVDVHEMLTRARGGSIVDESNVLALCRACHDWIHRNPASATALKLLRINGIEDSRN